MAGRSAAGKFILKSETEREVKSIRSTNRVWDDFGFLADSRRITRADLLEHWVNDGGPPAAPEPALASGGLGPIELAIAVTHLRKALELKANAGGAIKAEIREALKILE
jgi:hypothetical protein